MGRPSNNKEAMCETSERGEKHFSQNELSPMGMETGRRILEVFGYQNIRNIVFRLKADAGALRAVIDGTELPSVELLLSVHKVTGASIDWLLTGKGNKYVPTLAIPQASEPRLERTWRAGNSTRRENRLELAVNRR